MKFTNLEKVLFPSSGFSKRELIRYYQSVAPVILPHLRDRPLTVIRYPDGVSEGGFFEKECSASRPSWVRTGRLGEHQHCLVNDKGTLLWLANLAAIELHTTLATVRDVAVPNVVAFDLDPGPGVELKECAEMALILEKFLERFLLRAYVKTSGMKGLHVYVPLNGRENYDRTKDFARHVARFLELRYPDRVTSNMSKKLRHGKVFVDWSQNTDFKTTVSVYSLRAGETPAVSTPVTWNEIRRLARSDSESRTLLAFTPADVVRRIARSGDLFGPVLALRQALPSRRDVITVPGVQRRLANVG